MKNLLGGGRLRTWLSSVPIKDPIERQMATLLQVILFGFIAVILSAFAVNLFIAPDGTWQANLLRTIIFILIVGGMLVLLRRGYFRTSMLLIIIIFFGVETYAVSTANLRAVADTLFFFTLAIILSGLLMNRQALVLTFGLSAGVMLLNAFREQNAGLGDDGIVIAGNYILLNGLISLFIDRFGVTLRTALASALERESALRESDERFRSLSEAGFEGIMIHEQGTIVTANQAFARLFGFADPRELIGKNGLEMLPLTPESRQKIRDSIGKDLGPFEIEVLRPDGSIFPAETQGRHISLQGRTLRVVAMRDNTAHKQAEKLQAAIYQISEATNTVKSLEELYPSVHTIISQVMPARNFYIALYDAKEDSLSFPYYVDEVDGTAFVPPNRRSGRGMTEYVIRTGKPLLSDTTNFEELLRQGEIALDDSLAGSLSPIWIGAPLIVDGKSIGVMALQDYHDPKVYTERELQILEYVSNQVAKAIEHKRTEAETQRLTQELILLDKVRTALSRELELPALIRTVVESIKETLGYTHVSLYFLEGNLLVLQHQVGYERVIEHISIEQGISGRAVRTRRPIWLEDVRADPDFLAAVEHATSEICVPLVDNDKVVGTLNVESAQGEKLIKADLKLMEALAEHINVAIGRARLYNALQQRTRLLTALQEATLLLMRQLELSEVLQEIITQAAQLINVEHGYIYLVEPGEEIIQVKQGVGIFSAFVGQQLKPGEGLAGKVWQTAQPINVPDYHTWAGRSAQFEVTGFHAAIGVPLISGSNVIGVLGLARLDADHLFSDDDVDLLSRFAQLASIAFENARLYSLSQRELAERRIVEETLRESEALYRHAIETAGAVPYREIYLHEDDMHVEYQFIGEGIRQITGYGPEEFSGDLWDSLILESHPLEDLANYSMLDAIQNVRLGRYPIWKCDFKIRSRDGSIRWVFEAAVELRDEQGISHGSIGMFQDITERKQAEEARRENESRLQSIIDNEPECVKVLDLDGRLLEMNPAGLAMIEADNLEAVAGQDISQLVVPEHRIAFRDLTRSVSQGGSGSLIFEIEGLKGRHRWLETRAVPLRDYSGAVKAILGITLDITERKQAEEEIRKLNAELEQRVRERTAQLEAANKELDAFSYSVSHDLRAPLRAIDGYAHFLSEEYSTQLPSEGRQYLQNILEGSQRMGQLIHDLLMLSRVSRKALKNEPVNLSNIARAIAADLASPVPERSVEFIIANGLVVNGDAGLLQIVMENLFSNAWKYTSKRAQAHIEFGALTSSPLHRSPDLGREDGGEGPIFFIRDNGAGFNMAYADKLFGAFQRLHPENEFEGTGIGLATVQRIIQRHGGRIWAKAEIDKGATFYFTLR